MPVGEDEKGPWAALGAFNSEQASAATSPGKGKKRPHCPHPASRDKPWITSPLQGGAADTFAMMRETRMGGGEEAGAFNYGLESSCRNGFCSVFHD